MSYLAKNPRYRAMYKGYGAARSTYTAKKGVRKARPYVRRTLKAMSSQLGAEKKFFDSARSAFDIPSPTDASGGEADPTTLLCLNCPAQDDTETGRDGRQIAMDSVQLKGHVNINAFVEGATTDEVPEVMIALVLDTQTNAAQLDSEDVFSNPSANGDLAASPFRNLEWTKRFKVLKTVRIGPTDFAGALVPVYDGATIRGQGAQVPWSMYCDLKGMKVNFLSGENTSVIAAIADNSLHVIAYASSTSMTPQLQYNARLRFYG